MPHWVASPGPGVYPAVHFSTCCVPPGVRSMPAQLRGKPRSSSFPDPSVPIYFSESSGSCSSHSSHAAFRVAALLCDQIQRCGMFVLSDYASAPHSPQSPWHFQFPASPKQWGICPFSWDGVPLVTEKGSHLWVTGLPRHHRLCHLPLCRAVWGVSIGKQINENQNWNFPTL